VKVGDGFGHIGLRGLYEFHSLVPIILIIIYMLHLLLYSSKAQEKQQSHWMEGLSPPQSAEIKILA